MTTVIITLAALVALGGMLWAYGRRQRQAGRDAAEKEAASHEAAQRERQQETGARLAAELAADPDGAGLAERVRRDGF